MTIDVSEYFPVLAEEICPNGSDDPESLHLWRNSAFSKQRGQYSATITFSHLIALAAQKDDYQVPRICLLREILLLSPNATKPEIQQLEQKSKAKTIRTYQHRAFCGSMPRSMASQ
jgi:hypothetical protein